MLRRKRLLLGIAVVILLPAAALGWWLLSPLFLNKTVDEAFPLSASATVPEGMTRAQVEQAMADIAAKDQPVMEPMPEMKGVNMPASTSMPPPPATLPVTAMPVANSAAGTPGQIPVALLRVKAGSFSDADNFHKGSGQATIYRAPDGSHLLRLEEFRVTNGPDLHVLLTPHPDPKSRGDATAPGYVDLGKLKGNLGSQNYHIPEGVDVAAQGSVVIYCLPFQVVFSVAGLKGAG